MGTFGTLVGRLVGVAVDIGNLELLFEFAADFVHSRVHLIKKRHTAAA